MDGFDDLLNTSRSNPILDNPFEDPFARPRSPDPWLTFSPQSGQDEEQTTGVEHPSEYQSSIQPSPDAHRTDEIISEPVDPLDAKAANEEDEIEDRPPRSQLLGGSASHSSPTASQVPSTHESHVATSVSEPVSYPMPPAREPSPPPSTPSVESPKTPGPPQRNPSPTQPSTPLPPSSEVNSSAPASTEFPSQSAQPTPTPIRPSIVSPLDGGSTSGQHSFATLALGGEMPGWQGTNNNQTQLSHHDDVSGSGGWGEHENGEDFVNGAQRKDDDDDDDLPIAQQKSQSVSQVTPVDTGRKSEIQPVFVITVGDPQKVGDPVRAFITYTVHTRTTSPLYRTSSFSVLRRYSDFLWLYETLSINNPGVIVPPVPEKQQYGRFQDTFVENRRAALNKCIQKIANHPSLRDDADLKLFLESDSFVLDIKHRKAEIAHERGGLMASIGSSLVGPRFYETDEWFDNKKVYLDSLESQLRGLVKSIDAVSKQRNEVALSMAEFSENIAALASCDMSKQLSHTLSVLADVQRRAKELQDLQAREDVSTIMSTVDEYARLVNSVRLAFASRVRLYISWQHADGDVRKVQQAHEKARRQGRIPSDRVSSSLAEIAEAERRAMEAKQEFDNASKMIKSELARFEQERVEDFKIALMAFLDGMVIKQKEIIHSWESYQESLLKRMTSQSSATSSDPVAG